MTGYFLHNERTVVERIPAPENIYPAKPYMLPAGLPWSPDELDIEGLAWTYLPDDDRPAFRLELAGREFSLHVITQYTSSFDLRTPRGTTWFKLDRDGLDREAVNAILRPAIIQRARTNANAYWTPAHKEAADRSAASHMAAMRRMFEESFVHVMEANQ